MGLAWCGFGSVNHESGGSIPLRSMTQLASKNFRLDRNFVSGSIIHS